MLHSRVRADGAPTLPSRSRRGPRRAVPRPRPRAPPPPGAAEIYTQQRVAAAACARASCTGVATGDGPSTAAAACAGFPLSPFARLGTAEHGAAVVPRAAEPPTPTGPEVSGHRSICSCTRSALRGVGASSLFLDFTVFDPVTHWQLDSPHGGAGAAMRWMVWGEILHKATARTRHTHTTRTSHKTGTACEERTQLLDPVAASAHACKDCGSGTGERMGGYGG